MIGLKIPSQDYLKELLEYDPDTGLFLWRMKTKKHISCPRILKVINSRNGGKAAGKVCHDGYLRIGISGKKYMAHRLAWVYMHGDCEIDQIDHVNGNRSDNRIQNLRSIQAGENKRNMGISRRNTSGVVGVSWNKSLKKWSANIYHLGKNVHLGLFDNLDEAKELREFAQEFAGFHENHGARAAFK